MEALKQELREKVGNVELRTKEGEKRYHEYKDADRLQVFVRRILVELETKDQVCTINQFPYKITKKYNVNHYIVWTNGQIPDLEEDVVFFENPVHWRSVLEIRHFHVFSVGPPLGFECLVENKL